MVRVHPAVPDNILENQLTIHDIIYYPLNVNRRYHIFSGSAGEQQWDAGKSTRNRRPHEFPAGTLDRIDAALEDGEKRADFIRDAVERELRRRERHR